MRIAWLGHHCYRITSDSGLKVITDPYVSPLFNRFLMGDLKDDPLDVFRAVDSPFPDPDGFRLIWFHSSQKEQRDAEGRRIGAGTETYHTVNGYQYGIAAVLSNMANAAAHGGRAQHIPENDLFSVLLKCHDPGGEFYFLHLARNRVTVASYTDEEIRKRVGAWADSVPALR